METNLLFIILYEIKFINVKTISTYELLHINIECVTINCGVVLATVPASCLSSPVVSVCMCIVTMVANTTFRARKVGELGKICFFCVNFVFAWTYLELKGIQTA